MLAGVSGTRGSSRGSAGRFPDDDLPGFLSSPPGTPRPADDGRTGPAGVPVRDPGPRRHARVLAGTAATVLVIGALVTAGVLGTRHPSPTAPRGAAATPSPAAPSSAPPSAPPAALPDQPLQPSPGDPGAGVLAGTDLPVGAGDVGAHLAASGLVLAQVPAGVTAGFPAVALTTDGDRAVLHLDLPTANCLTPTAPARPDDAGCQPVAREFGDLASPALRMTSDGDRLVFTGRVPTYLRPDGAPPVWTGRTLDVTVTVDLPDPTGDGPLPAGGSVTIGDVTAPTLPGDDRTTVVYGR